MNNVNAFLITAALPRALSPTDVSQFIRLDQCQRYLRLRLHERAAGPQFLRDYGVTPQSIPPLLTRSGATFKRMVEQAIGQQFPLRDFAIDRLPGAQTNDNAAVLRIARKLPSGKVIVLFQPRLQVTLGGWRLRGDVDILRMERDADGALHLLVADMKSSTSAKVEHRLQVAFYLEMLNTLLQEAGISFAPTEMGILYRGRPAADSPTSRSFGASWAALARQTDSESVERRFQALLNAEAEALPVHLRHAVSLLRAHDVPIDWLKLLEHIRAWNAPSRWTQRAWARDYWGALERGDGAATRVDTATPSDDEPTGDSDEEE